MKKQIYINAQCASGTSGLNKIIIHLSKKTNEKEYNEIYI